MWSSAMGKTTTQKTEDCPYYYGPRHLTMVCLIVILISTEASAQQPTIWGQFSQNGIQKHTSNNTSRPCLDNETRIFFSFWQYENPDQVYVAGYCRNDTSTGAIPSCPVDFASFLTQVCPVQKEATARNEECLLRYSNHSFVGQMKKQPRFLFQNKFSREIRTKLGLSNTGRTSRVLVRKTAAGSSRYPKLPPSSCRKVGGLLDLSEIDCLTYLAETMNFCDGKPPQLDFIARTGRKNITFASVVAFASVSLILYIGVYYRVKKRNSSFETEDIQRATPLTVESPAKEHTLMSLPRRKWNAVRLLRALYNKVCRPFSGDMYVLLNSGAEVSAQRQLEQEARTTAEEELKAAAIAKGKRVAADMVSPSISSDGTSSKNTIIEDINPSPQKLLHHRGDVVTETLFPAFDRCHAKGPFTDLMEILQELKDKEVLISRVTEESAELDTQLRNANRVIDNLTRKLIEAQSRIEAFEASDAQKTRELKSFASKEESRVLLARKDDFIKEKDNRLQEIIDLVISNSSANDPSTCNIPAAILSLKDRGQDKSARGDQDGEAVVVTAFEVVPEEEESI